MCKDIYIYIWIHAYGLFKEMCVYLQYVYIFRYRMYACMYIYVYLSISYHHIQSPSVPGTSGTAAEGPISFRWDPRFLLGLQAPWVSARWAFRIVLKWSDMGSPYK